MDQVPKFLSSALGVTYENSLNKNRLQHLEAVFRRCSIKVFLETLQKFRGRHLCQSLFFNKIASLRPATLLKKRLWHRCFPVNFAKFLRTPFLTEHLRCLLLNITRNGLVNSFIVFKKNSKYIFYITLFDFSLAGNRCNHNHSKGFQKLSFNIL